MQRTNSKIILLHTCCAPCFAYPSIMLRDMGYKVISYFYNPNILDVAEFEKRSEELKKYCEKEGFEVIFEPWQGKDFIDISRGLEGEPEKGKRCTKCFELRLIQTAKKAFELGIENFSTTLTVSPHKVSKQVFMAGEIAQAQSENKTKFLPFDFKKKDGFKKSNEIAMRENMYRQNYCGCIFSKNASFSKSVN